MDPTRRPVVRRYAVFESMTMWRKPLISVLLKPMEPGLAVEDVLRHAVEHVPYYAQYAGCSTLSEFPLLTKQIIRSHPQDLVSDDLQLRNWYYETSGGSTGEPVRVVQDKEYFRRILWALWQSRSWAGFECGDRIVKLWGDSLEDARRARLKTRLSDVLFNRLFLNTFELTEERIVQYLERIRDFRPRLVVGYASSLFEISKYVLASSAARLSVPAVVSTAGTLYPEMREAIETVFGARVFNRYGSREVGIIAAEDGGTDGLRVLPTVALEIVDDAGHPCPDGEPGEIAVTSLANLAMPLIRYRIGDMGVLRTRGKAQYLEKVLGRTVEIFRTRSGKMIDGEYFTHLLYFKDWVKNFRFRQTAYDEIVVEIAPHQGSSVPRVDQEEIERGIGEVMGTDVRIRWELRKELAPFPSGKYAYCVCELASTG